MTIAERLDELGIALPPAKRPAGLYRPAVSVGDLLYLSGTGPVRADGTLLTGKVGAEVDEAQATEAARLTGLQILSVLRDELGDLERVTQVVRLFGMVNCAAGFNRTSMVIDGCSALLIAVLGERGRGARSAVGLAELPFDIAVEIEATVRFSP